jgi:hypothetical protein
MVVVGFVGKPAVDAPADSEFPMNFLGNELATKDRSAA